MNISLSPELESMIRDKVESGEFHDASEVVSEALRIMDDHERRKRAKAMLEAAVEEGFASLDRGEGREMTDELWEQLMAEGDARAARGEPIDPLITGDY